MPNKQYAIAFFIYALVVTAALILALLNVITLIQQIGVVLVAFGLLQLVKNSFTKKQ
jgi:hypothetical protein